MSRKCVDELYDAIISGDFGAICRLIRGNVDVNEPGRNGLTPLGAACHLGDLRACEALLNTDKNTTENPSKKLCLERRNIGYFVVRKDLDQDDNNFEDFTPEGMENLEWDTEIKEDQTSTYDESYSSLYKYYADILNQTADVLTEKTTNLNQYDVYGRTALHYGCQSGNVKIVELLIEKGANVNDFSKYDGMSGLHLTARAGHSDVLTILIDSGGRIDCQDANGRTPLHYACYQGDVKCVRLLLWRGANINALDNCDRTPLSLAAANNRLGAIEFLLSWKRTCRVNMSDVEGRTPLCEAISAGSAQAVRLLLAAGANVNSCHSHRLLHSAVSTGNEELVKVLCSASIAINSRDENGNTPLHLAVRQNNNIYNILITHGANVNALNTVTGASVLHSAVQFQPDDSPQFEIILDSLMLNRFKIDTSSNGETPLRLAVCNNKIKLATILLRYGASLNTQFDFHPDIMSVIESRNCIHLAKLSVYGGLYDLNQRKDIVLKCNKVTNVKEWFSNVKFEPMSLMQLCRILIRKRIGHGKVHFNLDKLGLPPFLNHYLDLKYID